MSLKSGHFGGHLRELFGEAVEAWKGWNTDEPEPTVVLEANYEFEGNPGAIARNARKKDRIFTVSQVCDLLWNCTDILPGDFVSDLKDCDLELKRRTYAAAARAIKQAIRDLPKEPVIEIEGMDTMSGYEEFLVKGRLPAL